MNTRRAMLVFLLAARSARLAKRSPKAGICYRINRALDQARNHFQGCTPEPADGGGYELRVWGAKEARLACWLLAGAGLTARPDGAREWHGLVWQVVRVDVVRVAVAAE